jgi:hypothetical protein
VPDVQSSQNSNNIYVNVFGGASGEVSESNEGLKLPPLSVLESLEPEPITELEPTPPAKVERRSQAIESLELHEIESFDQNPKLKRFKARTLREAEFNVDVEFLRHCIHTLIVKHNITITTVDVEAIMSFFGPVEIRTSRKHIVEREPREPKCGCFGGSERTTDRIVEVVKKVIVQGVNIAKYVPALVDFLTELGISL